MSIYNGIINQKGTPAFYSDIFANRPAFGYAGRVFISTDTGAIYEDTGTSWTLIADAGAGTTGTLQQVTTNGNTTTLGIVVDGININNGAGTGLNNIVFGTGLTLNTTGTGITAIGSASLNANTTGNYNTALGKSSLESNNTASNNTAIGFGSLQSNTSGDNNTANGYASLTANTTASNNTTIGYNSGSNITTGSNNTIIGSYAGTSTLTSNIVLSDGVGNVRLFSNATGLIGINQAVGTPSAQLDIHTTATYGLGVNGTGTANAYLGFANAGTYKWRIGNTYNAGANSLDFYNVGTSSNALSFNSTTNNATFIANVTASSLIKSGGTSAQILAADGSVITAGTNITISGGTIASSGGGSITLSAIGSTPNANAATLTGSALNLEPASASFGGVVTTGTQTFAGAKTFTLGIIVENLTIGKGAGTIATNTAIGNGALNTNTTGSQNTAIGYFSLQQNSTGNQNVAIGNNALQNNTNNQNTAIGYLSLSTNTSGANNTAIGNQALQSNSTGNQNIAIGSGSLGNNTASNNTSIGTNSLGSNTSGASNTAIGYLSLNANITGANNIAIGSSSGSSITTGSNNTIIGSYVGTTTLANNIVLSDGAGTIRYQWNGTTNNFPDSLTASSLIKSGGTSAQILAADGSVITAGTNITISGGTIASSGGGSMAIGGSITSATAGSVLYAGASGVLAQTNAQFYFDYTNNRLALGTTTAGSKLQVNGNAAIGYSASTAAPTNGMVVSGVTIIGSTTDNARSKLQVTGSIESTTSIIGTEMVFLDPTYAARKVLYMSSGNFTFYNITVGNLSTINGTTGVYTALSDINKKKDFELSTIGLKEILNIKPTLYRMLNEDNNVEKSLGFIAQQVKEFIPQAYVETGEGDKKFIGLNDRPIIAALVKSIQELNEKLERNNIN